MFTILHLPVHSDIYIKKACHTDCMTSFYAKIFRKTNERYVDFYQKKMNFDREVNLGEFLQRF